MNLEKAISFIHNNSSAVELARLEYLLEDKPPTQALISQLLARQRPDGGWAPFWAPDYSSLDATCFHFAQAEQLGLVESETALKLAVDFLARRQSAEGSWEEDPTFAESAPPWAKPGDLSAKLYLTSNCGFWLSVLGDPGSRATTAAEYLLLHLDQGGHLPGFLHTHWLAGGMLFKLGRRESAGHIFEYLGQRINDFAASNLAWMITTLHIAGVPASHPLLDQAAILLEQNQNEAGYWHSEDGAGQDVHATLEAVRALSLCGRV